MRPVHTRIMGVWPGLIYSGFLYSLNLVVDLDAHRRMFNVLESAFADVEKPVKSSTSLYALAIAWALIWVTLLGAVVLRGVWG